MEKITKQIILNAAAQLVEANGVKGVTIADVGSSLGVSHAAIYKHFKNKQDLWTSLSHQWLNHVLSAIFPFQSNHQRSQQTIAHDWLWAFAKGKMDAYQDDPEMFKLYTEYIDANADVLKAHIDDLIASFQVATAFKDTKKTAAVLQAFSAFSTPAFATTWGPESQDQFEEVWQLVKDNFKS